MLNKVPHVSEKLLIAAQERRRLLMQVGVLGLKVVGPGKCRDTMLRARIPIQELRPVHLVRFDIGAGEEADGRAGARRKSRP